MKYEIIIPKEESKQETVQKFIEQHSITEQQLIDGYKQGLELIFEKASKITKQETTLEEAIKPKDIQRIISSTDAQTASIEIVNLFAKWQQEQIGKSEFLQKLRATLSDAEARRLIFETFKKK